MATNVGLQVGSKWIWKDDTHSLEAINTQIIDRTKGRDRRTKGAHFQDIGKRSDRGVVTPSLKSGAGGGGWGRQSRALAGHPSPKQGTKQGGDVNFVTLGDVKSMALDMLSEIDDVSATFEGLYMTDQFNEFLMCLLNYFHSFNEKQAHEKRPNPMNIEPSLAEKKHFADLCTKLDAAQKQFGQSYGVLVLGIGLDHKHHMACGTSRVSATQKDRAMYEVLYSFCTFVIWITFRRKDFDTIKKEIGRILRSDTFNPAIRVKNATDDKVSPAEYRRLHGKRPAIKNIINQRSPALVAILPAPREAADFLFRRTRPLSPTSLTNQCKENGKELDAAVIEIQHLDMDKFKIGIIGERKSLFNPRTLMPLGADIEDEENGEEEKEIPPTGKESQLGHRSSRGETDSSHVSTEAPSEVASDALTNDE